jgi:hypothetical protein
MKLEKQCQYDLDPDLDPRNKIKEQFLHLDPDLDPAAQIYADPCVSGYGFGTAAPLFISVADPGSGAFSGLRIQDEKKADPESRMDITELIFENFYHFWIKNT